MSVADRGQTGAGRGDRIWAGAGDGIRTRDIDLGKVALYQLSYSRWCFHCLSGGERCQMRRGLQGWSVRNGPESQVRGVSTDGYGTRELTSLTKMVLPYGRILFVFILLREINLLATWRSNCAIVAFRLTSGGDQVVGVFSCSSPAEQSSGYDGCHSCFPQMWKTCGKGSFWLLV